MGGIFCIHLSSLIVGSSNYLKWEKTNFNWNSKCSTMESVYLEGIEACRKCIQDCEYCLIQMAGMESKNDCPLCCILCIESCSATLKFLMTESNFSKGYCALCADVCQWCAEQCGQYDHKHCEDCANSCVKCMEECRKIVEILS